MEPMTEPLRLALLAWQDFEDFRSTGSTHALARALQRTREGFSLTATTKDLRGFYLELLVEVLVSQYEISWETESLREAISYVREELELRPSGHDERPGKLIKLASLLNDLSAATGEQDPLREAIQRTREALTLTPTDHPSRPAVLNNLGSFLGAWHDMTGQTDALEEGLARGQEAVALTPSGDERLPSRLENLGSLMNAWYNLTEKLEVLEEAVACARKAVDLTMVGDEGRPLRLSILGYRLSALHKRTGDPDVLDQAIAYTRDALALIPIGHKHRAGILYNLGNHLSAKCKRTGEPKTLREALSCVKEAVKLTSSRNPDYPGRLSSLAFGLVDWCVLTGDQDVLTEAITLSRDALALVPKGNRLRPALLNNLGSALGTRYRLTGEPKLLAEAIDCAYEAVSLTPGGNKQMPADLRNVGGEWRLRYALTGSREDLSEPIDSMQEAVALKPVHSGDRANFLHNLGGFLLERYLLTQERDALNEAVACAREAVALTPPGHNGRAARVNNLSIFLSDSYTLNADRNALSEAIQLAREALSLTPEGHASRPDRLNNLGIYQGAWYRLTGDHDALDEAIDCARRVMKSAPADHPYRPFWLNSLAVRLYEQYILTGGRDILAESITCARDAVALLPAGNSELPYMLNNLGNRLGAWYGLTGEMARLEEAIDCGHKAVAMTPPGHVYRPTCLSNLGDRLRESYAVTGERDALNQAITCAREAVASSLMVPVEIPPAQLRVLYIALAGHLMERDEAGDWEEAHQLLIAALAQQSDELGRQIGERPGLDYLRNKEDLYRLTVRCCVELATRREQEGSLQEAICLREQAWAVAEQGKGRLFAALLASDRRVLAAPTDSRAAELLSLIRDLRDEQVTLQSSRYWRDIAHAQQDLERLRDRRFEELRRQIDRHMAELQALDPESASLTAAQPASLAQIRAVLPPQAMLLEFYPLDDQLVLFAIDHGSLRIGNVPVPLAQLTEWTRRLDASVQSSEWRKSPRSKAKQVRELLAALATAIGPVLERLLGSVRAVSVTDAAPELILVPTGPLHRWPLHLLPIGGAILWDAWSISYVPTADTLFYCAGRIPAAEQSVLMAPDPSLAGSFGEALLAKALGWEVAVKEAATPAKLAESRGNLALVTHVEPAPQQGGASLTKLWLGDTLGWVSAVEVLRLLRERPPAEHGELGSCAAHYEEARDGDHLQGLTRSFLTCMRSLTSTLWPVDDLAACYLGTRFRELLAQGEHSKAACLRQAALELRDGGWARAAAWLIDRISVKRPGQRLLLALAAAYLNAAGDLGGFLRLWKLCQEAEAEQEPYAAAFDQPEMNALADLADRAGKHLQATDWPVRQTPAKPLTELHWGPNVLIGVSQIARSSGDGLGGEAMGERETTSRIHR